MTIIEKITAFLQTVTGDGAEEAAAIIAEIKESKAQPDEIELARDGWGEFITEGELAVDDDALTSRDEKGKAMWVSAWVFVGHVDDGE